MDEHDEHGPFVDDLAVKILIHRMIQVAMLVTRGWLRPSPAYDHVEVGVISLGKNGRFGPRHPTGNGNSTSDGKGC